MTRTAALTSICLLLLLGPPASLLAETLEECRERQVAEFRKTVKCRSSRVGKALGQSAFSSVGALDLERCREKFAAKWEALAPACTAVPTREGVEAELDARLDNTARQIGMDGYAGSCARRVLRSLERYTAGLLKAQRRTEDEQSLIARYEKSRERYLRDAGLERASKGCASTAVPSLPRIRSEQMVQRFVESLERVELSFVDGACPSRYAIEANSGCPPSTAKTCHETFLTLDPAGPPASACVSSGTWIDATDRAKLFEPESFDAGDGAITRSRSWAIRPKGRAFAGGLYDEVTGAFRITVETPGQAGRLFTSNAAYLRATSSVPTRVLAVLTLSSSALLPNNTGLVEVVRTTASGDEQLFMVPVVGLSSPEKSANVIAGSQIITIDGANDFTVSSLLSAARQTAQDIEIEWKLSFLRLTGDVDADGVINAVDSHPFDRNVPIPTIEPDRPKVFVVGLDGAGWPILDIITSAGYAPNMRWLVENGARADLYEMPCSVSTCCFCPPIWNCLARGVPQAAHGMNVFTSEPQDAGARALWEALREDGGGTMAANWRNTFPNAQGIDINYGEQPMVPEAIARYNAIGPASANDEEHNRIQGTAPPHAYDSLPYPTLLDPPYHESYLPKAADRVAWDAIRRHLELGEAPSLALWLFHSPDKAWHLNWCPIQPEWGGPLDDVQITEDARAFAPLIPLAGSEYLWGSLTDAILEADAYLGEIIDSEEYDYLVLESDHAMGRNLGSGLCGVHGSDPQSHYGIFSITDLKEDRIVHGALLGEVTPFDVAATVAYALNLPVSDELQGEVLDTAFTAAHLQNQPILRVPSWERP